MPSLQIRELPPEIYETLAHRAEREGRSLAQQAIYELRKMAELEAREVRLATVERLSARVKRGSKRDLPLPETLIREDRDR